MIKNERQYHVIKARLEGYKGALAHVLSTHDAVHASLRQSYIENLRNQIAYLYQEMHAYDEPKVMYAETQRT